MVSKLMIPGPVSVEDEVLYAMGSPVQAHYGTEWAAIYHETLGLLQQIFKTQSDVHILVGSGSAGVDAAIGSLTRPGEKIIVGENGYFGQRLGDICRMYGLEVIPVQSPLGQPLNAKDFQAALAQNSDVAAVALVHLETSTTVLNPLEEIANAIQSSGVPLVVDAVSSLGGVPLKMDEWGIDICISASQKCLGAPPGLAPVAVSERAWQVMKNKPARQHGWYLNLELWQHFKSTMTNWHPYPVTMATNNVLALRAGVGALLQEGLAARLEKYQALASFLRDGLQNLGFQLFAPLELQAPVLTGVCSPAGIPSSDLVRYLYEKHNIRIAGGVGAEIRDQIFRIGHMGATITEADLEAVLVALKDFLKTNAS